MKIEFIELELDWPSKINVFELKNYILSYLNNYGEPLRWAITSTRLKSKERTDQTIFIEAVLITSKDNDMNLT